MVNSLHSELIKRIVIQDDNGTSRLENMTASQSNEYTHQGGGRDKPHQPHLKDVQIRDIYGNTASLRVITNDWIRIICTWPNLMENGTS
ncbi:hypothetical protein BH23BAC3_BH23BAC3_30060 [soil metagenome]